MAKNWIQIRSLSRIWRMEYFSTGGGTCLHWRNKKFSVFSNLLAQPFRYRKRHFLKVLGATGSVPRLQSKFIKNLLNILLNINWKWIILMKFSRKFTQNFWNFFLSESFIYVLTLKFWTNISVFGGDAPEFREKSKILMKIFMEMWLQ